MSEKSRVSDQVRVACQTCIGTKRDVNQDTLLADEHTGLFIVADGMGGHNAGEIASAVAVREISDGIRAGLKSVSDVKRLLEQSVLRAHTAIFEDALENEDHQDMGTTVVMALIRGDRAWFCHVGDSRAYLVWNDRIRQMTKDHTFLADMVEEGRVTVEQARTHPARHALTMALGLDDEVEPDIKEICFTNGQCILLCSDGLTDVLDDRAILDTIRASDDLNAVCRQLVTQTKDRGGSDDITIILTCR